MFGVFWSSLHTLIILFYTVILIFVLNQLIKNIKYYNRNKTLLWIESKNFKTTTPLTALEDSPANVYYNKQIWFLHKSSVKANLKNINFILPNISFTKYDPLYIRYLLFLFISLAFFGHIKIIKYMKIFLDGQIIVLILAKIATLNLRPGISLLNIRNLRKS